MKRPANRAALLAQSHDALTRALVAERDHWRLSSDAERQHGAHGPLVSGVVRAHFPEETKDHLRRLARKHAEDLTLSLTLWKRAGYRRETWLRKKEAARAAMDRR